MLIEKLDFKEAEELNRADLKLGAIIIEMGFKLNQVIAVLNGITQLIDNVDNDRKREKEE